MSKKHVFLCLSLDVEEEGLFRSSYALDTAPVSNLQHLRRLRPLCELGAQPTLFCAYPVLKDDTAWRYIEEFAGEHTLEIGAHMHHWNTPPGQYKTGTDHVTSVPASLLGDDVFSAKLESILSLCRERTGRRPVSFRMGRWDLHAGHWPLLAKAGLTCDASVRPLHMGSTPLQGPDHYTAPQTTPYTVSTGYGPVFEVPLTVTSLSPLISRSLQKLGNKKAASSLQHWGALALLPVYHPLWAMKAVTSLSIARGNDVLSLTWHSSEMMPGGNPHMPDAKSIDAFMAKCHAYLVWLMDTYDVTFVTMDGLRQIKQASCPVLNKTGCDWTCPAPQKEQ